MLNQKNIIKTRIRKVFLVLMSTMLLVVGISCGDKETEMDNSGKTPEVMAPDTQSNEEAIDDKEGPSEPNKDKEELSSNDLKDLFKSGKEIKELSYTMEFKGYGEESITSKIWLKNEKMRFESSVMGQTVITIIDEESFYTLSVNEKMAMKVPIDNDENLFENTFTLDDVTSDLDSDSFTYLGKEKINGETCLVIESNDKEVGTIKMWLHEKYGVAMKMETNDADKQDSYVMEVTDFNVGNVSEDMFQVPKGYKIMDFGNLEFPVLPGIPKEP